MERIINSLICYINDYWNIIEKAVNIDKKLDNPVIKKEEVINLIKIYNGKKKESEIKDLLAVYYGYPYITLALCMEALSRNVNLMLITDEYNVGTNTILVNMFNDIINEFSLSIKITYKYDMYRKEIDKYIKEADKTICIGDEEKYREFKKANVSSEFIPFNNIMLFCKDDELEELKRTIYDVCMMNRFDIELFGDFEELESTIDLMNDYGYTCVLLSNDETEKELFKSKIKKEYFINKNPINYFQVSIPEKIFKK